MRKINYKSDFDFVMRLKDASGKEVPFPECDWDAEFWTSSKQNAYRASCIGGEYVNCFRETDGSIHFILDNHHLGTGALKWEPHFRLPNDIYPDSVRDTYSRAPLEIELVSGQGEEPTEAEVEYILPYIKGDAFTWDDFTAEQIQVLQKPATDAATEVKATEKAVQDAEALRVDAEKKRDISEMLRQSCEQERQTRENIRQEQEAARQSNETIRQIHEQSRVDAEALRVTAEQNRATEFAEFKDDIEEAKMKGFIDMWNAAWGKYGKYDPVNAPDPQHPFFGNELWLTYKEAVNTYLWGNKLIENGFSASDTPCFRLRTNMPPINNVSRLFLNLSSLFLNQSEMEVCRLLGTDQQWLHLSHPNDTWLTSTFNNCRKLRKVIGVIDLTYYTRGDGIFAGCVSLEDIQIFGLKIDIDISPCPKLSADTISYLVNQATNGTNAITVTVHPDVYAKLTGDTTNEAAAALTADELSQWQALLTKAAGKHIAFASA